KFNKKTIITVILTIVITVAATLVGEVGLGLVSVIPRRDYEKYKKFNKLIAMEEMIKETYYKDVKEQDLIDGAMKGLFMGTG
ncbi:hypothetical protein AAER97_03215, partial [Acinetobacter baumannii]